MERPGGPIPVVPAGELLRLRDSPPRGEISALVAQSRWGKKHTLPLSSLPTPWPPFRSATPQATPSFFSHELGIPPESPSRANEQTRVPRALATCDESARSCPPSCPRRNPPYPLLPSFLPFAHPVMVPMSHPVYNRAGMLGFPLPVSDGEPTPQNGWF